ncbi:MAG: class I SAM-dependent methyltransferase [Clostridiales bacterium]|nr:class I SAM-dependent methyltransferase [Clostridiales bacterium]
MNEVNKTLYIPLYGKSFVSKKGIILQDTKAEEIWGKEGFELKGRSKSKWLAYNMAMRARVFDDWTDRMLENNTDAIVIHIGCGLDSRCLRVKNPYNCWFDCDFPDVLEVRKQYYQETSSYHMMELDAADTEKINELPEGDTAVVILEGISMYLTNGQLKALIAALRKKYLYVHVLLDVYTEYGAKASEHKNPINDVGVTKVYGVDDIDSICEGTGVMKTSEHSFTPKHLIDELNPSERCFFKMLFTGKTYSRIYRLFELKSI